LKTPPQFFLSDTEGSFVVERVAHMAQVVSTHIQLLQKQKKQTKEIADKAAAFTQKVKLGSYSSKDI
jgi:hypothetical protein